MERESFEDEGIAALMNQHFVCIKVDREERPDLDEIYMAAPLALNRGQGAGQKLRRAMVRPGRDRLTGEVEGDETYVGGVESGGGRRHLGNKALVVIAAHVDGDGIGRIRLRRSPDASSRSLRSFVEEAIEPGATVITDGWEGYEGLKGHGYKHRVRVISGSGKTASALLPRVHRVASLLKRW